MLVSHIGYDPKTQQYLVFFISEPEVDDLARTGQHIRQLGNSVSAPRIRTTSSGQVVSFAIKPGFDVDETMARALKTLQPILSATALMLKLEYLRSSCMRHYALDIELDMVPGLGLQGDDYELRLRLEAHLLKMYIPYILPRSGDVPVVITAGIRVICRRVGFFAQGIRVIVLQFDGCVQCPQT
ncbi:MAG TPA: hypothetical protein VM581_01370 [Magnetospirillaceae bacterium]|nr:hypothetical protein [Magnetospirillaceae bacterium]